MEIKEDILNASKRVGINPYTEPFKASDLGLTQINMVHFQIIVQKLIVHQVNIQKQLF